MKWPKLFKRKPSYPKLSKEETEMERRKETQRLIKEIEEDSKKINRLQNEINELKNPTHDTTTIRKDERG